MARDGRLLAAALGYARRGLRVLPIAERAKRPLTAHGKDDATMAEPIIRRWWTEWPTAGVAVAVPETWTVVDVDVRHDGFVHLAHLLRDLRVDLPDTLTAETASGGAHYVYTRPAHLALKSKLTTGVDLLHYGKYFLVAPTPHPCRDKAYECQPECDRRYAWTIGREPAEMPRWLAEYAASPREDPALEVAREGRVLTTSALERARKYLATVPPAVSGQGGSKHTFLLAQRLVRGFELSDNDALLLLESWNRTCVPPWLPHELRRKVSEARTRGTLPLGLLLNAPPRMPR